MAIQILSFNAHPDPKYAAICSCGCKFTFNYSDADYSIAEGEFIECPYCHLTFYKPAWYLVDPLAEKEWK